MEVHFDSCKTPEQWVDDLADRGIKMSARTLRSKAREHAQFYLLGRVMLLNAKHLNLILEQEARLDVCRRPSSENAK